MSRQVVRAARALVLDDVLDLRQQLAALARRVARLFEANLKRCGAPVARDQRSRPEGIHLDALPDARERRFGPVGWIGGDECLHVQRVFGADDVVDRHERVDLGDFRKLLDAKGDPPLHVERIGAERVVEGQCDRDHLVAAEHLLPAVEGDAIGVVLDDHRLDRRIDAKLERSDREEERHRSDQREDRAWVRDRRAKHVFERLHRSPSPPEMCDPPAREASKSTTKSRCRSWVPSTRISSHSS